MDTPAKKAGHRLSGRIGLLDVRKSVGFTATEVVVAPNHSASREKVTMLTARGKDK
jgi:hypothetical protein